MVSRIHAICIRLGRMADRCKLRDGETAEQSILAIDKHDVTCLLEAVRYLTEYEAMKVERENRPPRSSWGGKR